MQAEKDFKQDDNPDKPKYFAQWYPLNADAYVVAIKNLYVKSHPACLIWSSSMWRRRSILATTRILVHDETVTTWTDFDADSVAAANEVQQRTSKIGGAGSALLADAMKQAAAGVDGQKHIPGYVSILRFCFSE